MLTERKDGGMEGWRSGGVEEWRGGGVEGWGSGGGEQERQTEVEGCFYSWRRDQRAQKE